jgi:ElaB/YqjD/DUF883 family membrane-anchored ribosome-binding protein
VSDETQWSWREQALAAEGECVRLRAQVEQNLKEARHAARRIGEGARERDRLRAVVAALMPFVDHGEDCATEIDMPCNCGLDLILAQQEQD